MHVSIHPGTVCTHTIQKLDTNYSLYTDQIGDIGDIGNDITVNVGEYNVDEPLAKKLKNDFRNPNRNSNSSLQSSSDIMGNRNKMIGNKTRLTKKRGCNVLTHKSFEQFFETQPEIEKQPKLRGTIEKSEYSDESSKERTRRKRNTKRKLRNQKLQ